MASTSQANNANGFTTAHHHDHHQSQQQHPARGATHLGRNAHNLVAVASAAGYTTDHQLAGLVEAATAAADQQDMTWPSSLQNGNRDANTNAGHPHSSHSGMQNHLDEYGVGMHLDGHGGHDELAALASGAEAVGGGQDVAHQHGSGHAGKALNARGHSVTSGQPMRKRRRVNHPNVDPAITGPEASQFEDIVGGGAVVGNVDENASAARTGNDGNNDDNNELRIRQMDAGQLTPQQAVSDARSAGVHSAVALFRQPSSTSKKHTRPPMSKMFTSLELSPENFLHLQAAAKAYMLDENHPERRDCVGQRGKGDMEMVKLRLWNCVRDFLDSEGNGLRFFGQHVVNEGVGQRNIIWPRDEQKIISLVMPLLRRMVTNERQRQYAVETRKGGGSTEDKKTKNQASSSSTRSVSEPRQQQQQPVFQPSFLDPDMELSMQELLTDGYPTDIDTLARSYCAYNQDCQLDNLGSISGLPENEWCGLVRAVDSHYQITHNGNPTECDASCEQCLVNHIISSDSVSHANWRIGDSESELSARTYFATGITRDVSRIIRESLLNQSSTEPQPQQANFSPATVALPQPSVHDTYGQTQVPSTSVTSQGLPEQTPITIRVSILEPGQNKRLLPRLDLPADQCPDFSTLSSKVRQYHQHSHQHQHQMLPPLRIRAWLENGMMPIQNDGEWMVALLAVSTAEWMDGELRIVVDDARDD